MSERCLIQRSSRRPDRVQDDMRANRSAHSSARAHNLCNVVQVLRRCSAVMRALTYAHMPHLCHHRSQRSTPPPWSSCRTTVTAAAVKTSSH
eukprot:1282086-Prymnesium_polylepis.1